MKSRILKIMGFSSLLAMYIFIAIALNNEIAKYGGNFMFPCRAEQQGWCDPLFETDIYPPVPSIVAIDVYLIKETPFVFKENDANYPEVTPITVIAIQKNSNNTFKLYDGSLGSVILKMELYAGNMTEQIRPYCAPYQLVGLEYNISSWLENPPSIDANSGKPNWRGLFYELKEAVSLENALNAANTSNGYSPYHPNNVLEFHMGGGSSVGLIGVKTWNYQKGNSIIPFRVTNLNPLGDIPVTISPETFSIPLNIDSVNIVRERAGETDHGLFIVEGDSDSNGKGRTYSDIVKILMDAARKNVSLPGGGGLDWLQVAAANIYNNPPNDSVKKIFNCVQQVRVRKIAEKGKGFLGYVYNAEPSTIYLNPYGECMRFNLQSEDFYGYINYKTRENVIHHEALHCYANLKPEGVYDEDDDGLIVGTRAPDNGRNIYFKFCWDSGIGARNFIRPDYSKAGRINQYLKGFCGDGDSLFGRFGFAGFQGYFSVFVSPLDYLATRFHADIPEDLPNRTIKESKIWSLYFYNSTTFHEFRLKNDTEKIFLGRLKIIPTPLMDISKNYGKYTPNRYYIVNEGWVLTQEMKENFMQLEEKHGYRPWILYDILYRDKPGEYDASYFGITHGE